MKTVENASPQQYLRLLITRLLETQKCLQPFLQAHQMAGVRLQLQTNAYTLLEIKSWLEVQGDNSQLGPSPVSARVVENSGDESSTLALPTQGSRAGDAPNAFVWRAPRGQAVTTAVVLSSMPLGCILPDSAVIMNGRVTFLPPSSPAKRRFT